MELFNTDRDDRGQVGIGTLIVFIAMVLVAAIAAGVLINTAGFLQTQAEDTGTQSTEQVANNLNVITEVGNVSANDTINSVRVGLQPASGADNINLAKLTVQYVSDSDFENIVVGNDTTKNSGDGGQATGDSDPNDIGLTEANDTSQAEYLLGVVTAENEDDVVMTDGADRYELIIPVNNSAVLNDDPSADPSGDVVDGGLTNPEIDQGELDELEEGEELELRITTQAGSQTVAFLQVPDSLSGDEAGSTVNL